MTSVAVIGGGAAGFFAAIHAKRKNKEADVVIFEKSGKLLSKVLVSGGGRCNVTHHCLDNATLIKQYPRGRKVLKQVFRQFSVQDTIAFFENAGVVLKTESDGRMFPITDDSETIAMALVNEAEILGIRVIRNRGIKTFKKKENKFKIKFSEGEPEEFDKLILACGGFPKLAQYDFLSYHGIVIDNPVPSLFTFNIAERSLHALMGVSADTVRVKIEGRKDYYSGPLLITHWGLSGPAVLRASAWEAAYLNEKEYQFRVIVDWTGQGEIETRKVWQAMRAEHPKRKLINANPFEFPQRLWEYILNRAQSNTEKILSEMSKQDINRLVDQLVCSLFDANGKTTFKEEFVTAGGVSLDEINPESMESHRIPGLYFAGEIVNMDGVTGGFNFQAAWSSGFVAGIHAVG